MTDPEIRLAQARAARFAEMARGHRRAAAEYDRQADAALLVLPECPTCEQSTAPWCQFADCGCSESCHDRWHALRT